MSFYCENCEERANEVEASYEAELAALRAEVLSAMGQAQQHLEEVERLRSQFANSEREVGRLRAALEWYANPQIYWSGRMSEDGHFYQHDILWDRGLRARTALGLPLPTPG